jgi:hypothetical protein
MLRTSKRRPAIVANANSGSNRRGQAEDDKAADKQRRPMLPPWNPIDPVAQVPAAHAEILHRQGPEVTNQHSYDACSQRHGNRRCQEGNPFVWRKSPTYQTGQVIRRNCVEDAEANDHR